MIRMSIDNDVSVRFYADDLCVVARYDGVRQFLEGPVAIVLRQLNDLIGLRNIRAFVNEEIAVLDAASVVREEIRKLVHSLDVESEGNPIAQLWHGSAALLHSYCVRQRIPLMGMCEITHMCNMRCRHCYLLHKIQVRPPHAESAVVSKTIRAMANLGCLDLTLTGGEPTLHNSYLRFVKEAKALHLYTTLKTNGTTFTRNRVKQYAEDPAHQTELSLYGATPVVHDAFTSVPGSFYKTVRGMRELARVGIRCNVNCVVWKGNAHTLADIKSFIDGVGHNVVFADVIQSRLNGDHSPLNLAVSAETRARLISEGYLTRFTVSPCIAGQSKVKIDADGNVFTCELLPQSFGNVYISPLEEVWHSKEFVDFSNGVVGLSVSERDDTSVVRSCPGLNFLNTGRLHGKTSV